jgi:hypothetical protein
MSAAAANSSLYWTSLIAVLATGYALPVFTAIVRNVEDITHAVILNAIPIAWPATLVLDCMPPRKDN